MTPRRCWGSTCGRWCLDKGPTKVRGSARPCASLRHVPGGGVGDSSAVVVDDLDVVPVGVQDERAVVARVVDGALAGTAVVLVPRGQRGGVERPHGRVVLGRECKVDVL